MILSGIHVFRTAGFPLEACGNDILYKRLNVQLIFAKFLTATQGLEANEVVTDTVCFHCQQAAEKYLKAFLVQKQN